MKEYKLDCNNCSYEIMEKFYSGIKNADGYKLVVTALISSGKVCDFVFTVKTDINAHYYASYYSDTNSCDYKVPVDGFTEIIDLFNLLNRKEDIEYFLFIQEGKSCTQ